ncbi:MAG: alkaline phosphatase family protein [Halorientalis sp.]
MTDTIVLGLDGATWDVLDPLVEAGRMPNLEAVLADGRRGVLESTVPPVTAPAWLSMATGQNPGKTGVYYFLNRTDPDSYDFEPMSAEDFRGKSFWDVLADDDTSVGVFNFPVLHPPYDLGEGSFVVSGFGASAEGGLTAPAELEAELDEVTGGYEYKVPYADPKYTDRPERLEADLHRVLEKQETAMVHLLEKRPDVFFGVVSVTDWAQHYFWRYHDPDHVLHEPGHEDALADLFARVDETVGRVAEFAEAEGATLLVVSDHGFGPTNGTFYSNEWLEQEGFRVPESRGVVGRLRSEYFPYLRRVLEPAVSRVPLLRDLATSVGRSVRASAAENIDYERSVAFMANQGLTSALIYLVDDGPDARRDVTDALEAFGDERGLNIAVRDAKEIYHGPKVDLGPDLVVEIEGLEYVANPRYSTADDVVVERPPVPARSGGHRHEGIYAVTGPDVAPGEGERHHLLDVAPTILALQGSAVPSEMDGDPMTDAFTDLATVERAPLSDLVSAQAGDHRGDPDELRDRLEDLGYL